MGVDYDSNSCYYNIINMSKKDYYQILGIEKKASPDDIKKAFFKIASKHHPDKGGDDKVFKEASEAYSTLSDEKKRREYDMYGQTFAGAGPQQSGNGFGGFEGFNMNDFQNMEFDFGDLGDIFGDMFGGGAGYRRERRGRDISIEIEATFKESVFGIERNVLLNKVSKCDKCNGHGGDISKGKVTCEYCNGKGRVTEAKRTIMGVFQSVRECDRCEGSGEKYKEKCDICKGNGVTSGRQEIKVVVPPGMAGGEMIRMSQMGEAVKGGIAGDLYVKVRVAADKHWSRIGNDLIYSHDVKLSDAILGATHNIIGLDGDMPVTVPAGSNTGDVLKVKARGVPYNGNRNRGEALIKLNVVLPKKLDKETKKLIEGLRDLGL